MLYFSHMKIFTNFEFINATIYLKLGGRAIHVLNTIQNRGQDFTFISENLHFHPIGSTSWERFSVMLVQCWCNSVLLQH